MHREKAAVDNNKQLLIQGGGNTPRGSTSGPSSMRAPNDGFTMLNVMFD